MVAQRQFQFVIKPISAGQDLCNGNDTFSTYVANPARSQQTENPINCSATSPRTPVLTLNVSVHPSDSDTNVFLGRDIFLANVLDIGSTIADISI